MTRELLMMEPELSRTGSPKRGEMEASSMTPKLALELRRLSLTS